MNTTPADHQELRLTENQKKAVTTLDRNLCVTAGAGSGKTTVLVDRYIYLLEHGGMEVHGIAAITFTEKAANQMKEKIRDRISERIRDAANHREREPWVRRYHDIGLSWIHTIHGLCTRILKENAVEAGMDPHFMTLNETETLILIHKTIRDFIHDRLTQDSESMIRIITAYGLRQTTEILTHLLQHREEVLIWAERYLKTPDQEIINTLRMEAKKQTGPIADGLSRLSGTDPQDKMEQIRQQVISLLSGPDLNPEILKSITSIIDLRVGSRKNWDREDLTQVKELLREARELSKRLYPLYDTDRIDQELNLLRAFLEEFDLLQEQYRSGKSDQGVTDFDDLLILARDLLRKNPEVRERYHHELKTLLMDELQDTDRLQMEIVHFLCGDEPGRIFAVGDAKQSIYSFRGADVTVFQRFQQKIRERDPEGIIPLNKNFRSQEEILNFINTLFVRIFPSEAKGNQDILFEKLEPHKGSIEKEHFVEAFLIPSDPEEKKSVEKIREQEARFIAFRIRSMVDGKEERIFMEGRPPARAVRFGDIAILFRAMTDVKIYEKELRHLRIPFTTISGSGFFETQEITDILSLLRLLLYPDDETALAGLLRSPIAGIRDETLYFMTRGRNLSRGLSQAESVPKIDDTEREILLRVREMIGKLRRIRDRVRIPELIGRFLDMTGYPALLLTDPVHGKQRYANLKKIMDLARDFSTRPFFGLPDFMDYIQELKEKEAREAESPIDEETEDTVRILTIHKAKGLEFPVVFLPDLSRKSSGKSDPVMIGPELGVGIRVPDNRGSFEDSYIRSCILDEQKVRQIQEEKRLFYVAATRAKDFLVLSGQIRFPKNTRSESAAPMDWIKDALGITEENCQGDITYGNRKIHVATHWQRPELRFSPDRSWLEQYPELIQGRPLDVPEYEAVLPMLNRAASRPAAAPPRRFTVSQLLLYKRCPRGYEISGIHGISEPAREDQNFSSIRTGGRELGSLTHDVLRHWDLNESSLSESLERELHRSGFQPEEQKKIRIEAFELLRKFSGTAMAEQIRKSSEIFTEVPFVLRIGEYQVEGVIDKFFRNHTGRLILIDYKTDAISAPEAPTKAEEYRLQLATYALAACRLFGEQVDTSIVFLHPGLVLPVQNDPDETEEEILSMVREIQTLPAPFPMCPDPNHCLTCGYWETFCSDT